VPIGQWKVRGGGAEGQRINAVPGDRVEKKKNKKVHERESNKKRTTKNGGFEFDGK